MLTCKARITDVMKRAKAMSLRPPADPKYPECGGDISIDISIYDRGACCCGDYCYCESSKLEVKVTCSKCRNPFIDEDLQGYDPLYTVERLVKEALETRQVKG